MFSWLSRFSTARGARYKVLPGRLRLASCLFIIRVENEKIIIQIVRIREVCDQNGDRVSKKDCHIFSVPL